jgi:hypothetical protein
VRQGTAHSNIVSFPASRSAQRFANSEETYNDNDARMPFGLCLIIWAALAVIGWGALDAASKLI